MAAAAAGAHVAAGPMGGPAFGVIAAMRAARAAAHAASGIAWQYEFNSQARLARAAESALEAGIAGLMASGVADRRGRRRRRAVPGSGDRGRGSGRHAAEGPPSDPEPLLLLENGSQSAGEWLTDDPLGFRGRPVQDRDRDAELEDGFEDKCAEFYGVQSATAGSQTCGGEKRTIGVVTAMPPRASRGVQTTDFGRGDSAQPALACGSSEEAPASMQGTSAAGSPQASHASPAVPASACEISGTEIKPRRQLMVQISDVSTAPELADVALEPSDANGVGEDDSYGKEKAEVQLQPTVDKATGKPCFTAKMHDEDELAVWKREEHHGFIKLTNPRGAICLDCMVDIPVGVARFIQLLPEGVVACKGCVHKRMRRKCKKK